MFYVGNPPEPVDQRIKTLYKDYLPIVQYHLQRKGVTYNFTFFAADLGGGLEGLPVNFVKVQVRNDSREERTAFVSSAWRLARRTTSWGALPNTASANGMTSSRTLTPKAKPSSTPTGIIPSQARLYCAMENPLPFSHESPIRPGLVKSR